MLIPATFNAPEGTTVTVIGTADLSSTYESELNVPSTNIYSTEVFTSLEKLGVVALPCSGARNGTIVFYVNEYGDYFFVIRRENIEKCASIMEAHSFFVSLTNKK